LALFGDNENEMIALTNRLVFYFSRKGFVSGASQVPMVRRLATNAVHLDSDYSQFGERAPTTGLGKAALPTIAWAVTPPVPSTDRVARLGQRSAQS